MVPSPNTVKRTRHVPHDATSHIAGAANETTKTILLLPSRMFTLLSSLVLTPRPEPFVGNEGMGKRGYYRTLGMDSCVL